MKKRTFVLAILSVLALTSCDMLLPQAPSARKRSSKADEESEVIEDSYINRSSSSGSSKESMHRHSYGYWTMVVAPTCTEKGVEERVCECGEKQTREVAPYGHMFDEYVGSTATCTADGYDIYRCTRCGATTQYPARADHEWGAYVVYDPAAEGYVGYNVYECIKCNWYQKIEIKALDGTLGADSMLKDPSGYGFMKLAQNGNSMSWKFNLDIPRANGAAYHGVIYQRGYIDYVTSNDSLSKTYLSGKNNGVSSSEEGNFRIEVNGEAVDKTPYLNLTYGEMTAGGEDSSWIGTGGDLSPIGLCPIGEVYLNHGFNEIKYTRLDSYNLIISDIVMIVEPYNSGNEHVHAPSTEWSCSDTQHWHGCAYSNCPDPEYKVDVSSHIWGEKYDEVAATCETDGSYKRQCSVCGYVRTYTTSKLGHTWYVDESYEIIQPTRTTTGRHTVRCSTCNTVRTEDIVYGQTRETALTVDEAVEIGMTLQVKGSTEGIYYVKGVISEVVNTRPAYNTVTAWLASSSQARGFEFYSTTVANGINLDDIVVGMEVLGYGPITRYQETTIEFSGRTCYLESIVSQASDNVPLGTYTGSILLSDGSALPIQIAISVPYAFIRVGSEQYYKNYAYEINTNTLTIEIDENYGTFTAKYYGNSLLSGQISGAVSSSLMNNGSIALVKNKVLWDCNGTTEELRSIFKRRYRQTDMWTVDTNNVDRITSYDDPQMCNCLRLRGYSGGAVALNLAEDFETPLECSGIGFWVYNESENDITLRMWMYRGAGHTSAMEIGSVTALAGQWTYCSMGFTTMSTYNFQIADFTNSGVPLRFDNICFF